MLAQLPQNCLTVSSFYNRTNADLTQTLMSGAVTTWLSPRFDRMNVLSKAIKVSVVFERWDGWRFDDGDEKQYIDPKWTVIPVMWWIFTELFYHWKPDIVGIMGEITEAWALLYWQLGYIMASISLLKQRRGLCEGLRGGVRAILNVHPDWLMNYTPISSKLPPVWVKHVSHDFIYSQKTLKCVH